MVAAVQSATTLPVFLFALFAGVLADLIDRRKFLLWLNLLLAAGAFLMTALVHLGLMTPALLLLFAFFFGTGVAFLAPAWQAIVPSLVPREDLTSAIALNSIGINVSRAIGPALAGLLIVALGLSAPFLANAVSFIGILLALWFWKPEAAKESPLPRERVLAALRLGLRFALNSPALKATLVRAVAFFLFASAFWALLPIIAKEQLSGGATLYGLLMGAAGAGAVLGGLLSPRIKARWNADQVTAGGTVGLALVLCLLALVPSQPVAMAAAALAGFSWIGVLASLNVSAQTALPNWVRARGLSIFLTVFFGSLSLGSLVWGQIATLWGLPSAMLIAAAGALLAIPLVRKAHLGQGEKIDHTPSGHWPEPLLADVGVDDQLVLIEVEYRVKAGEEEKFKSLMAELAASRRRGGGLRWSLTRDSANPSRFVERWWEGSWEDHLRHHARVSVSDEEWQKTIDQVLLQERKVTHQLSVF